MKNNKQKGTSLLLTILIMATLLVIALAASRLGIGEIRLTRDISKALIAYYAAETGVEAAIFYDRGVLGGAGDIGDPPITGSGCLDEPDNEICYSYEIITKEHPTEPLTKNMRFIKSNGSYKDTERAVELTYELLD